MPVKYLPSDGLSPEAKDQIKAIMMEALEEFYRPSMPELTEEQKADQEAASIRLLELFKHVDATMASMCLGEEINELQKVLYGPIDLES